MTAVQPASPRGDPLPVLYRDARLLVVDKPAEVVTVPGRGETGITAFERAWAQLGGEAARPPRVLHRLDKGTSGVLAFALDLEAQREFGRAFTEGKAEKTYLCLLAGAPPWDTQRADHPLGPVRKKPGRWTVDYRDGKPSETTFTVLRRFRAFAWVEARPRTGRTHQIRLHAKALGYPLAFDPFYGRDTPLLLSEVKKGYRPGKGGAEAPWLARLPLHAARLVLPDARGLPLVFEAPLPKELARVLRDLEKYGA